MSGGVMLKDGRLLTIDLQWFAAEDEGRTEEPSEVKLEKARKEGRVVKSQELNGALVMLSGVVTLMVIGRWLLVQMESALRYFFTRCAEQELANPAYAVAFAAFFLKMVLPVAVVGLIAGVFTNIAQNKGWLFSTKPIEFQFSKILPRFGQYFKKTLFSAEGAFNVAKSLVKVAVISGAAYLFIRSNIPNLLMLLQTHNVEGAVGLIASIAIRILAAAAIFFLVIAIPDYFVQKHQFMESMRMTKQEVKEEYKEMEGDPEVKGKLQQMQRQLLQRNMPRAVAESDVVITNPTHYAVALKYDPEIAEQSPQVVAKGADQVAFSIKRIAREHDVPIVENRPLARGLYTDTQVGDIIPEAYLNAIVLVYREIKYYSDKK